MSSGDWIGLIGLVMSMAIVVVGAAWRFALNVQRRLDRVELMLGWVVRRIKRRATGRPTAARAAQHPPPRTAA